mmetsp:Transcript_41645/g.102156  ORF Transcript_41645/g.102156 Transcript_41645/m.102156 type:complete len:230 (-) Transcript_41645:184-873(-)
MALLVEACQRHVDSLPIPRSRVRGRAGTVRAMPVRRRVRGAPVSAPVQLDGAPRGRPLPAGTCGCGGGGCGVCAWDRGRGDAFDDVVHHKVSLSVADDGLSRLVLALNEALVDLLKELGGCALEQWHVPRLQREETAHLHEMHLPPLVQSKTPVERQSLNKHTHDPRDEVIPHHALLPLKQSLLLQPKDQPLLQRVQHHQHQDPDVYRRLGRKLLQAVPVGGIPEHIHA